jgi:hypothetical protein
MRIPIKPFNILKSCAVFILGEKFKLEDPKGDELPSRVCNDKNVFKNHIGSYACILKAHSHSMSGGSI